MTTINKEYSISQTLVLTATVGCLIAAGSWLTEAILTPILYDEESAKEALQPIRLIDNKTEL